MDNNKYLDKVVGSLVRSTKIYYDKDEIHFPFLPPLSLSFYSQTPSFHPHQLPLFSFTKYCKNVYGLTYDEINYVWGEYRDNILEKIENGE